MRLRWWRVINITFFIGNGFDLNLGLKTRFSDVINEYLKIETNDTNIKNFQEEFNKNYINWSDFEKALGEYTKKFSTNSINDLVAQIDSFRNVLIKKFKEEEARIDYLNNKNEIITTIKQSLTEFNNNLSYVDKQAISPILSISRENNNFSYYFVSFNYTSVIDRCIEIINSDKENIGSRNNTDQKGAYPIDDRIEKVIHIHGTLQDNFILGVDNVDQIPNEELKKDSKFNWKIVKPLTNKELKKSNVDDVKKIINTSSMICIFGMSIGETDKTWWRHILAWLNADKSRHLVIFNYNKNIDETNPRTTIDNRKSVENIFFSVVGIVQDQERNQLVNRIHIASNDNMFKMDILSSEKTLLSSGDNGSKKGKKGKKP